MLSTRHTLKQVESKGLKMQRQANSNQKESSVAILSILDKIDFN